MVTQPKNNKISTSADVGIGHQFNIDITFTFTFSHLADAFIQSDLQLGNTWSDSSWRGNQTEEVLVTPSLSHCSNKYKLAREGDFFSLDVEFTLNFGHPTSQPKFNQISTSYDVVCLFCACWEHGMFKSILNLFCLKRLHENTKVLENRKVWACSIDLERRGSWSKKKFENHCFR